MIEILGSGISLYIIGLLTMTGIYAILCLALNIQWGFGGLFNAGIAGFYAVGAYTSAILTAAPADSHVGGFELPVIIGIATAGLFAAIIGYAVARSCIRLKSDYLAMASIGIAEVLRLIIVNESWLTNGSLGVSRIPKPWETLPQPYDQLFFAATIWLVVLAVFMLAHYLQNSPWGRVLRAIRDNENAARAVGKNVEFFRVQAFALGAAIMGIGGAVSVHFFRFLSPEATEPLLTTFLVWVMLIAGGSGNNLGAILGAGSVWILWSTTELVANRLPPEWATRSAYLRVLLIGLLLQFVLQKFPGGILKEKTPKLPEVRR